MDYIHLSAAIPPKLSISSFMGYLKGKSTLMIYDRYPELQSKWIRHFGQEDTMYRQWVILNWILYVNQDFVAEREVLIFITKFYAIISN